MRISIAIDGPAGAGKSTIAKLLGEKYSLMYINTGAMYRAITLKALENNYNYTNIKELTKLIDSLEMHFDKEKLILNGQDVTEELYTPYISKNVSLYAAVKEIREKLVCLQKNMAEKYNVIMDGRDIGTVVLKDADLKIFLTASAETRAQRRYDELISKKIQVQYDEILQDIKKRDYIDSNREVNPLTKAKDAIVIDTSLLNINEVVSKISICIDNVIKKL